MSDKEYMKNIKQVCDLLQSDPTPDVILRLRDAFDSLSKQLKTGPFLEVFEATLSNIPFSALFSLLTAPDNRLIVTVAEVTSQLLRPVNWPMVHQTFEEYIIQGLDHPHPVVKSLVLKQFLKCEQKTDPFSAKYGPHIWRCLEGKSDSDTSKLAKQVLEHLCAIDMCLEYLLSEKSVQTIKTLLSGDESQRFRVYDVVVAAIKQSDSVFEFFRQEGIVDLLLKEADTNDVLVTMNFYELVPALCTSSVPFEYLDAAGVFDKALEQIRSAKTEETATSSLIRMSALKLFVRTADAGGISPAKFLKKYAIVPELTELILLPDPGSEIKATAIACLGTIGSNSEALEYLSSEKAALAALVSVYNSSVADLRVECLRAISCIFGYSATPSGTASQVCYELYTQLDNGKFLVGLTKEIMKGFEESCIAGFSVLQKIALHAWGVHEIASYQNIVNFLLMRDPSRVKAAQQWQFAVIESIVNSPDAKKEFDGDTLAQLNKYAREGPYYVGSAPQVALQSS
ncbi:hypothetical protein COEREDRAFT_6902 [Coemansia reversa NRRL 1564]|uniref:ARM repeat-containing protein n=1 Tax=Coemansia reversa (strain ATCC 12441 / NRRL 1564) TaxID=763665 RepID=A0A2G5BHF4_COERN|nr:hypothetical protein COEREDRAFT_6902 [Coemansia reversa NRRL 1564]|eukprot:PIA18167.1 hypothetical protein COEREDRAFT_6902 [Coemansia reversa NRRL 1564]